MAAEASSSAASGTASRTEAKKGKPHCVAKGKSITCARGVLAEGDPVTGRDFCKHAKDIDEGNKCLADLVSKGYIVPASKDDAKK